MKSSLPWPTGILHPAQRRYLAEDLIRLRRSDEQRRYAAPQRAARIDPNPHQIEAVIFALARIREGGCILADEVGLGKTIEAGLVISQLIAEGARRVLLVAPKPLLGQWRQELFQLFDLDAREAPARPGAFEGEGVFLVGREAAGSERGREALMTTERFDLCVIDEAHEVFANVYKRFNSLGHYDGESLEARTAGRVREVLQAKHIPVLLLTATPIQNSLAELWGLVQFVDPLGTLLGDLPTFREVFCGSDDRQLMPGQEDELRSRIEVVAQRTLRRQAQPFLEKPFVDRQAKLFEYTMGPAERALYDDVTRYLLEPGIVAFAGSHRQLLLLGFHRRMASSTPALAASLLRVASRLRRKLEGSDTDESERDDAVALATDLEDDETERWTSEGVDPSSDSSAEGPVFPPEVIRAELQRVEGFIERARAVQADDSKFRALLRALTFVMARAEQGQGAGKLVVFTESLVTQDYLRARLIESHLVSDEQITVFRGSNDSKRAREALKRWREETPQGEGVEPSPEIATRLALVHEFRTRSKVFLSTEAGAKGLNLQFCDTLVNYDLPWNPQRIEQRIGRCHRYGQKHSVTVINFLASDNEAQRLTFEILSQKLELFGTVLSASDEVLHKSEGPGEGVLVSAVGAEFEAELRRIYDRARTLDEVTAELKALRERVGEMRRSFEETRARTASLIESSLDARVQRAFRSHKENLPAALAEFDRDMLTLVLGYLRAHGVDARIEGQDVRLLVVSASPELPASLQAGIVAAIGSSTEHRSLHLAHPLVVAAIEDARAVNVCAPARWALPEHAPDELQVRRGERAHLRLVKVSFDGFERVEVLAPVIVFESGEVLTIELSEALLRGTALGPSSAEQPKVARDLVEEGVEETLFALQGALDQSEQTRFERAQQQAARFIDDRLVVLRTRRRKLLERGADVERRREAAIGSEARSELERALIKLQVSLGELDASITRLEKHDEPTYRAYEAHIHERRYAPPRVSTLLDMELVIE